MFVKKRGHSSAALVCAVKMAEFKYRTIYELHKQQMPTAFNVGEKEYNTPVIALVGEFGAGRKHFMVAASGMDDTALRTQDLHLDRDWFVTIPIPFYTVTIPLTVRFCSLAPLGHAVLSHYPADNFCAYPPFKKYDCFRSG